MSAHHSQRAGAFLVLLCLGTVSSLALPKFLLAVESAPAAIDADHAAKMTRGLELFKSKVGPLLVAQCLKCHGGETIESEFSLADRDALLKGGAAGTAIKPGDSHGSRMYKLLTHAAEPHMPDKAPRLSDENIQSIADWIDSGAPYDAPLKAGKIAATPDWTMTQIDPAAKKFWSFQPLQKAAPPRIAGDTWSRTAIDPFIKAGLDAEKLTPNAPAERRQLIRRAYFDLIGLPPTPEQIAAFVNDPSPDAWSKVIDHLLASPHYGERWGRHWLDLVRFAESHGFEHDSDRPTAYHYRDFVIRALNADMPYDQFIRWQLAGDEIAPDNAEAWLATGFLAAGVHSTQITKNEVEKQRYDELDDMLSTTTTSMLGLTVGCCRCHDHKFDPFPQADYYRLLSTFTTVVRSDRELPLNPQEYQRQKQHFDLEHQPLVDALKKFETTELPSRLARWQAEHGGELAASRQWRIVQPTEVKTSGGAILKQQPDGSLLASGKNPEFDSYTLTVDTELTDIRHIRLEALADASLAKHGPGRAANGNFALSDFKVSAAPRNGSASPQPLTFSHVRATFEQNGLPAAAAIDDHEKTAWAIDPKFGQDHAIAVSLDQPVGFAGGTRLVFTLVFKNNAKHAIGRPRLSLSTDEAAPELATGGVPETIVEALKTSSEKRSAKQTATLMSWYGEQDADWRRLNDAVKAHAAKAPKPNQVKALVSGEGIPALRLHTQGDDFLKETNFLKRGDVSQKQAVASQGFLQVLMPAPNEQKLWQVDPPAGSKTSYRRRSLANWMTDADRGAGALLARVEVNRLWQHHFGRGLVATPSDFGSRGEAPSHPELLDFLAAELIRNGWQLKPIHKLMMTSAAYQMSSQVDPAKLTADRDNRWLWRQPLRRLEAEVIRDSMLSVCGQLDETLLGAGTLDPASRRRSIYFTVKRSQMMPMMQVFDAPDALQGQGERGTTTVPPQALMLMNNPRTREAAQQFAARLNAAGKASLDDVVRHGYLAAIGREPGSEELADSIAFIKAQAELYDSEKKSGAHALALADFCQTLLSLNEFVYVE